MIFFIFLDSQAFRSWSRTTDPSSEDHQTSLQIWSAFNCQEGVRRCQKTCWEKTSGEVQSGGCYRTLVKSCSSIFSLVCAFSVCLPYLKKKQSCPVMSRWRETPCMGAICVCVCFCISMLASLWIAVSYVAQAPPPVRQHRRVSQVKEERGKHEVQLRALPDLNVVSKIHLINTLRPFSSSILSFSSCS